MIGFCSGRDGVGKSTLLKLLKNKIEFSTQHFSAPKNLEDGKKEYFDFINIAKEDPNKLYILDRFYEGECTYAPIYRNYTCNYMKEIESELIKQNGFYIYIKANDETVLKRTRIRGEDFAKEEDFSRIADNYEQFLLDQKLPFIIIDNSDGTDIADNVNKLYSNIIKIQNIYNIRKCIMPRGNINAKYFIISDNNNDLSSLYSNEDVINKLKEKGIYTDCWFTNYDYLVEQNLIKPQYILRVKDL